MVAWIDRLIDYVPDMTAMAGGILMLGGSLGMGAGLWDERGRSYFRKQFAQDRRFWTIADGHSSSLTSSKGRMRRRRAGQLWVRARIVHGQTFGLGVVVESLVGGNHRHRGETGVLLLLVDVESGGELRCVRGA